jgi:carbon monoxide dehydrogenase subunit G
VQLQHEFVVPVPVEQAWEVLLDVERIAPCMPGASIESFDGENIAGRVKVKVGPIQVTYAGQARFVEKDVAARRVVLEAKGKESRGTGTAAANIVGVLVDEGGQSTRVTVTTDLAITGKPAQFGRGVMVEVGNKLIGRFADCLAEEIGAGPTQAEGSPGGATAAAAAAGAPQASSAASGPAGATSTAGVGAGPGPVPSPGRSAEGTTGSTGSGATAPAASPAASGAGAAAPARPAQRRESEPIDLLDTAGLPVLKRLAPVAAGLLALLVLWRLLARRR